MMALTTLLVVRNHYPVPLDFKEQESILSELSDQIEMPFEDVLEDLVGGILRKDERRGAVTSFPWGSDPRDVAPHHGPELVPWGKRDGSRDHARWARAEENARPLKGFLDGEHGLVPGELDVQDFPEE